MLRECKEGLRFQARVTREVVRRWPGTLVEPILGSFVPDLVIPEIGLVIEIKRTLRKPAVEQVLRYRRICSWRFDRPFRAAIVARWAVWIPATAVVLDDLADLEKEFTLGVLVFGGTV